MITSYYFSNSAYLTFSIFYVSGILAKCGFKTTYTNYGTVSINGCTGNKGTVANETDEVAGYVVNSLLTSTSWIYCKVPRRGRLGSEGWGCWNGCWKGPQRVLEAFKRLCCFLGGSYLSSASHVGWIATLEIQGSLHRELEILRGLDQRKTFFYK